MILFLVSGNTSSFQSLSVSTRRLTKAESLFGILEESIGFERFYMYIYIIYLDIEIQLLAFFLYVHVCRKSVQKLLKINMSNPFQNVALKLKTLEP